MFDQFPKRRPPLPKEFVDIHLTHYKLNRDGQTPATSLAKRMESWLHKQVANDLVDINGKISTLEIGAGTLNHLAYEPEVGPYDIIEPFKELYEDKNQLKRIRNIYSDIDEISSDNKYNRIISIAAFEHICNLPEVIAKCGLLLIPNGSLRISIPSEGTLLWKLAWKLTTGLEFRLKYGLDYALLLKHEHVNTAKEIEELLNFFFKAVNCRVFGINTSLSLYQFYVCKTPEIEKCLKFAL